MQGKSLLLALLLSLSLALAGCNEDNGDTADATEGTDGMTETGTSEPEPKAAYYWSNETLSGSFSNVADSLGDALLVPPTGEDHIFRFVVANGTERLSVVLTVSSPVALEFASPGCSVTDTCAEEYDVQETIVIEVNKPAGGEWSARMFGNQPGLNEVDWNVEIGRLVPE